MKDYKEMTESVLQQANVRAAQRTRQRRMATGLIAATLCFAILIAVVGFGVGGNPSGTTQPTISMENPTTVPITQPETTEPIVPPEEAKVFFLNQKEGQLSKQYLMQGMAIPVSGQIRVRSFWGMTEEERELAILEEDAFREAYKAENWTEYMGGSASVRRDRFGMFTLLMNGSISLEFADQSHVSSVDMETTDVGTVSGGTMCYTQTTTYGEGDNQITFPAGSVRYLIFWGLSYETETKLMGTMSGPYSDIKDTITITVNYSNGAQQTLIIDVTVDDDGHIYMTQRGNSTGV